jgi:excinuclease UvrABC ATPase subunit
MQFKIGELVGMDETLKVLLEHFDKKDIILQFKLGTNRDKIQPTVSRLRDAHPDLLYQEFDKKRIDKLNEISEKDETGNPVLTDTEDGKKAFKIPEDKQEEFNEWIKTFSNELNPLYQKWIADYSKIANEEIELDMRKIKLESLKDYTLSNEQLASIMSLIEE